MQDIISRKLFQRLSVFIISFMAFSFFCVTDFVLPAHGHSDTTVIESGQSNSGIAEFSHHEEKSDDCSEHTVIAVQQPSVYSNFSKIVSTDAIPLNLSWYQEEPQATYVIDNAHYINVHIPDNFLSERRTVKMMI